MKLVPVALVLFSIILSACSSTTYHAKADWESIDYDKIIKKPAAAK